MMSPLSKEDVNIKIKDELMSAPYVHMTMNLMEKFGATVTSRTTFSLTPRATKYVSPKQIFIGEMLLVQVISRLERPSQGAR